MQWMNGIFTDSSKLGCQTVEG